MLSNYQGRSESLNRILAAVKRMPGLSPSEERVVAAQAAAGDDAAAARLIAANMRRVLVVARSYRNLGLPLEDLVHEGALGLLAAVRHFDPARNVRFFTYAAFSVRRAMVAAIARSSKVVRVPRHVASRARTDREAHQRALAAGDDTAAAAPLAYEVSLDEVSHRGTTGAERLLSAVPDPADTLLEAEERQELASALTILTDRERTVLAARFGLHGDAPRTLREVGADLRLSKERVRQIEERATRSLRDHIALRRQPAPPGRPGWFAPVA